MPVMQVFVVARPFFRAEVHCEANRSSFEEVGLLRPVVFARRQNELLHSAIFEIYQVEGLPP